jgi:hypothetical protein
MEAEVGAAHLKIRGTSPLTFRAVASTFVNATLTLLTHMSTVLSDFSFTFVNITLTKLTKVSSMVVWSLERQFSNNERHVAVDRESRIWH